MGRSSPAPSRDVREHGIIGHVEAVGKAGVSSVVAPVVILSRVHHGHRHDVPELPDHWEAGGARQSCWFGIGSRRRFLPGPTRGGAAPFWPAAGTRLVHSAHFHGRPVISRSLTLIFSHGPVWPRWPPALVSASAPTAAAALRATEASTTGLARITGSWRAWSGQSFRRQAAPARFRCRPLLR